MAAIGRKGGTQETWAKLSLRMLRLTWRSAQPHRKHATPLHREEAGLQRRLADLAGRCAPRHPTLGATKRWAADAPWATRKMAAEAPACTGTATRGQAHPHFNGSLAHTCNSPKAKDPGAEPPMLRHRPPALHTCPCASKPDQGTTYLGRGLEAQSLSFRRQPPSALGDRNGDAMRSRRKQGASANGRRTDARKLRPANVLRMAWHEHRGRTLGNTSATADMPPHCNERRLHEYLINADSRPQ